MTDHEFEYFQRLINAQFDHIRNDIKELKEDASKILQQTTKTNGRLIDLEKWQAGVLATEEHEEKSSIKSNWMIGLVVTIILTVGTTLATVWATKQWH